MEKIKLELYTDYLICNNGFATATGLSAMIDGDISHDQMTRFLSSRPFTSKDLWEQVKPIAPEQSRFHVNLRRVQVGMFENKT